MTTIAMLGCLGRRGVATAAIGLLLACGSSDGGGSGPTADLTGTVRDADGAAPIAGASVSAGGESTTTAADGSFTLLGLRATTVALEVEAAGYLPESESMDLQPGANARDVELTVQTIYEFGAYAAYIPPKVERLRGVLVVIAGFDASTTGLVRGDLPSDPWHVSLRSFAQNNGFAILGEGVVRASAPTGPLVVDPGLIGLAGAAPHHPELQHAPALLLGLSWGGCRAYEYAAAAAARVIGFITMKGGCHPEGAQPAARSVPGYIFVGEEDTAARRSNLAAIFEANRPAGALWAIAVEPGTGHTRVADVGLIFQWLATVTAMRLPAAPPASGPVPLVPLVESQGWLGDRLSFDICAFACFSGNHDAASWLPTESAAESWQEFVSADGGGGGGD